MRAGVRCWDWVFRRSPRQPAHRLGHTQALVCHACLRPLLVPHLRQGRLRSHTFHGRVGAYRTLEACWAHRHRPSRYSDPRHTHTRLSLGPRRPVHLPRIESNSIGCPPTYHAPLVQGQASAPVKKTTLISVGSPESSSAGLDILPRDPIRSRPNPVLGLSLFLLHPVPVE